MVSGAVRFISGASETVLSAGGFFAAAISVPHAFGNASEVEPARYLLTVSPQRYVGYFREVDSLKLGPDGLPDLKEILALGVLDRRLPALGADQSARLLNADAPANQLIAEFGHT